MEQVTLTNVSLETDWAKITVKGLPDEPGVAARLFRDLANAGVDVDIILQNFCNEPYRTDLSFTVRQGASDKALGATREVLRRIGSSEADLEPAIALVNIEGVGMRRNAGILARLYRCLERLDVDLILIQSMERKIICVVPEADGERACAALRATFQEDVTVQS